MGLVLFAGAGLSKAERNQLWRSTNAVTTVGGGTYLWRLAVNPLTNQIFALNLISQDATVLSGPELTPRKLSHQTAAGGSAGCSAGGTAFGAISAGDLREEKR